jgi:hypothetical protein
VRDLLKETLIPFISDGLASQTLEAGGLCLVAPLRFIIDLAASSANLIGWKDLRVQTAPYLRNYGLVNALWMGVLKFWGALPPPLRPSLADHKPHGMTDLPDLTSNALVTLLAGYLRKDFAVLCEKQLATDVKLIQFWTVQISKLLTAYPETAPTVWKELLSWHTNARGQFTKLENSPEAGTAKTAAFTRAMQEGSLWVRCARLQRQALLLMPVDQRTSCIRELQKYLNKLRSFDATAANQRPEFAFAATVELLGQAGSMSTDALVSFLPLFKEAMLCIPSASCASVLSTADLRQNTADSLLVYMLSLASSAASTQNTTGTGAQQAWEACQLFLMECSMLPHPYVLSIMSIVWSSLIIISDGPTTKHYVVGMHELLTTTAATEAAATAVDNVVKPSSPITQQLTHLLGVLLASVPAQMTESFCERFLKLEGNAVEDLCQLAAVSAVLRAASCSGRPVGENTLMKLVSDVFKSVSKCIGVITKPVPKQLVSTLDGAKQPSSASLCLYLAWAIDCLGATLESLQSCCVESREDTLPSAVENAVTNVAKACMTLLSSPNASTAPYQPAVLQTLSLALRMLPTVLSTSELTTLTSYMEQSLHAMPAAAAGIAELTPALATQNTPPKMLFEALLGPSQSASLQFLGREAYVKYAKECFDENVLGALPRQWLDPSGMKLSEQGQPVMEKYLSKICSVTAADATNPGIIHPFFTKEDNKVDLQIKKEVEKVARDAGSKLAEKRTKAMEVSVKMVEQKKEQVLKENAAMTALPKVGSHVKSAAVDVMSAVQNLKKVWENLPAKDEGVGAAEAVALVKQARDALTTLLA